MIRVQADSTSLQALESLADLAEIVSGKGKVIGHFIPAAPRRNKLQAGADHPAPDALEGRLAAEHGHGITTREVFERLLAETADPSLQAHLREKIQQLAERSQCATP